MYICINMAISDPLCVSMSGQARREEPRQIDSQKERAAVTLVTGTQGAKKPCRVEGGT